MHKIAQDTDAASTHISIPAPGSDSIHCGSLDNANGRPTSSSAHERGKAEQLGSVSARMVSFG